MTLSPNLLLTFYGDDFTGSTDVMESLVLGGVPCVLFLEPPTPEFIRERFPNVRAVGVAGVSRSMSPSQMDAELPAQFSALKALGAPLFHYKICSTFDSSPTIGSIGHAVEIGRSVFMPRHIPLMVGAPILRRYVAFGNLFATFGEVTYRIDRHPTMRHHPITPMDEGDLRLHLSRQTTRRIGLIDLLTLSGSHDEVARAYHKRVEEGDEIILFDTLDAKHLRSIGELIWSLRGEQPVFAVGSSGIEYALTTHWQETGWLRPPEALASPGEVERLLVITGSAAPQTHMQINWALEQGFHGIRLDSSGLIDPARAEDARIRAITEAEAALADGRNVVIYSTLGPDDPAIEETRAQMHRLGFDPSSIGSRLGAQQGVILRTLLERTGLRRVCVAGGDTCGHAARQLDIYALEIVMPVAPGSPLCRARSHHPVFDGLEISLKAGQVGKPDYFGSILRGRVG
jgi:uncharacterized protein YgbK (DUF1537 family)